MNVSSVDCILEDKTLFVPNIAGSDSKLAVILILQENDLQRKAKVLYSQTQLLTVVGQKRACWNQVQLKGTGLHLKLHKTYRRSSHHSCNGLPFSTNSLKVTKYFKKVRLRSDC